MKETKDIPIEFLRECFEYNPETGILIWKVRPDHHGGMSTFNTRYAGKPVGTKNRGYLQTRLHYNGIRFTTVNVHRICWALATGSWPEAEIDHINAIHNDNRLCNLRDATRADNQNNPNNKLRGTNRSGYRGVHWNTQYKKWIAIFHREWLGFFDDPAEASKAYQDALAEHNTATKKP